jgi:c-di-GMP-binding flagellar brake protein YcgR
MTDPSETNPAPGLTPSNDDSRFLLHNRLDILRILRGLSSRNEMVSAFFNNGKELLLTSIIEVDAEDNSLILDYGSNEDINRRILASDRIIFVSLLDSVKIQFVANHIELAAFEGGNAFRVAFPDQVLQLQRREYYRLPTPIINPIKCLVPLEDGKSVEVPLSDIGAGGIGIIIGPDAEAVLKAGESFPGCRINLPGVGMLEVTLRIQSTFEVPLKNGNKGLRAGCRFEGLRPAMESLIQRYIIKLERDRIASA